MRSIFRVLSGEGPNDRTEDIEALAEAVRLQPVDAASLPVRPDAVAETYAELEYDDLASEQDPLWEAEGLVARRESQKAEAATEMPAEEACRHIDGHRAVLAEARDAFVRTRQALRPFRRREPGAKKWYLTRWGFLLGGDVAGQAGAALSYGEHPVTAIPQALATGMAALTAGMVGGELRDLRGAARRHRESGELPETLVPYEHLFRAPDLGLGFAKVIIGTGVIASLTIAGGIYWLRAIIEGSAAGFVYGLLAIGIALASGINAYFYTDEIADQIDAAEADYARELERANHLASHPQLVRHLTASTEATSVRDEHAARGRAAGRHITALKWRILRNNPGLVGHGFGLKETPIGRRTRAGGER
ncbi:hypothetical protein ACWZJV_05435 [Nocardioides sp. WG-D5]